ncbi:MAG: PEP-CTERM sorting domain-containing protein [Phycisphaerales bacterium]|nr:PEP-CTERM sorting domain-containing protein [Phycisphaerales bacterium]
MRFKYVLGLAASMALGLACSVSQAAWVAPSGGWEAQYNAADGKLPGASTPAWVPAYPHSLTTDAITGEKALYMDNNQSNGNGPFFQLKTAPGAGTVNDTITVDFRFRLLDENVAATQDQFSVMVQRPRVDGNPGNTLFFVNFSRSTIHYYDGGTPMKATAATIGTTWHDARWLVDVANNSSAMYLDGSNTPVITVAGWIRTTPTTNNNLVQFGDGTGGVWGGAELSYWRMTNSEMAPIPEPTSVGLLMLGGGAAMLLRHKR